MKKKIELRRWQEQAYERFLKTYNDKVKDRFLVVAGVGSGKTLLACYIADHLKKIGDFDSIVVISPFENIKRNWSKTFEMFFGLKIDHDYKFKHHWPRDCHGISITYHILSDSNIDILGKYVNERTLLIVDEIHHCGEFRSWGDAVQLVGELCGFKLLLTGTPDRGDSSPIPFVEYRQINEKRWELKDVDFSYTYGEAVEDQEVCPVIFQRQSAEATTMGGLRNLDEDTRPNIEGKKLYNQIITVKNNGKCWVHQTFLKANEKLNELNDRRNENFGGLIICNNQNDARALNHRLTEEYGYGFCELVISDDVDSSRKIEKFQFTTVPWMISVRKVSEGVDIPRLRVLVNASNYTTTLFFIQVMGRIVRTPNHLERHRDVAFFYMADYRPLLENANLVKEEILHVYDEIEEQEEQQSEREERGESAFNIEDIVLEAESVDSGNVYSGEFWDVNEDYEATTIAKRVDVSKDIVLEVFKAVRRTEGQESPVVNERPPDFRTSTEKKKDIRKIIKDVVGKIAYQIDGQKPSSQTIAKVHFTLNQNAGIRTSNTATEEQMKRKLKLAEEWWLKLKN